MFKADQAVLASAVYLKNSELQVRRTVSSIAAGAPTVSLSNASLHWRDTRTTPAPVRRNNA